MLNKEFEIAGDKELADTKEWFFRENVRLAEEKERIFEERRKLEHEFRIKHDTLDKKISIAKLKIVQLDEATKLVEKKFAALLKK